jgi:hypothetical protein
MSRFNPFRLPSIVFQDAYGNFSANIITAKLDGSASSFREHLSGDVSGGQGATKVKMVGNKRASDIVASCAIIENASSQSLPNTLVKRDADGSFAANEIRATQFIGTLQGSAQTATQFTGELKGDVIGFQTAAVVDMVGDKTAIEISSACSSVLNAVPETTPLSLVRRDALGNFTANEIHANKFIGTIDTNLASAINFTGPLAGDVSGTQSATVVNSIGGKSASEISNICTRVENATNQAIPQSLAQRDLNGNISANEIHATLFVGPYSGTAASSVDFTGSLSGEVSGTQTNTIVNSVGGVNASRISSACLQVETATSTAVANTLQKRDLNGSITVNEIVANKFNGSLIGSASSAATFTNPLAGDISGNQNSTQVLSVGGKNASEIASACVTVANATHLATPLTIVKKDYLGNVWVNELNASAINGPVTVQAASAINFSGNLSGDVTGTQGATVVTRVGGLGGYSATQITDACTRISALPLPLVSGTNAQLANTLVQRTGAMTNGYLGGGIYSSMLLSPQGGVTFTSSNTNSWSITDTIFNGSALSNATAGEFTITPLSNGANPIGKIGTINYGAISQRGFGIITITPRNAAAADLSTSKVYGIVVGSSNDSMQLGSVDLYASGAGLNSNGNNTATVWNYHIHYIITGV